MVMSKLSLLALKRSLGRVNRELITASSVAVSVLLLRSIGLLQSLEWAALDKFFQLRPSESEEKRITIVAIDEASLRQVGSWPIPDGEMAKFLHKIQVQKPRAIGLDIYRDLPVGLGNEDLVYAYKSMPNLIGIELLGHSQDIHVLPPLELSANDQVGFNNVLFDADGKVRRSLLYSQVNGKQRESFALKLAKLYLKTDGIDLKPGNDRDSFSLGKTVFHRFQSNHGAYVRADAKGYQIISNFPKPACKDNSGDSCHFLKVSMRDVLSGKVPENLIRDRIVLVGSTAPSLQDFFLMPYSSRLLGTVKPVAGIELQAYFISELISAALKERPLIKVWSTPVEWLWILAWAYLGSAMRWRTRKFYDCIFNLLLSYFLLAGSAYFIFLYGWWIPLMPALLTFTASAVVITFQIAHMQEELKRSKDFLHQVINTIPDPIFVKNERLQWIVLNEAYCQLIGYSKDVLLDKSDYNFFPKHEADVFQALDKLVLRNHKALEHEEEFTNANGNTYFIATKRSLHKDAAGNLFLVGVIRDITERKQMELQLKRTAAQLFHSNNELKLKEDHFRYLAYHDPLTGLTNRKYFIEQLSESIAWAQDNNLLLALLFIDLDGFKQVNDTLGHEVGDRLLITIGQRLNNCLRGSDTVSRLGGDEFTVILRAIPKLDVAVKVAEKILTTIAEPIVLEEHTTQVSASIGISIYPLNSQDSEALIKQADAAMYRAKHLGKNRTYFA
jgi:diguanylate cyclase (GGDEF)-like protein/PAS domain S-box-containing protein